MHGSESMTSELIAGIDQGLQGMGSELEFDVLVCPPTPYLMVAKKASDATAVKVGAQNVNANESGAYTGEVSLSMLADLSCDYVLLGHSERRELYAETDADIAHKFTVCSDVSSTVIPILCVGETLAQRQSGETENVLATQIDAALDAAGIDGFNRAVIAYEPVWAIGTGETASPAQAQAAHQFIRSKLASIDGEVANKVRILYGGSMKPSNAQELLDQPDIDGGLIGGASLQAESFVDICKAANHIVN